MSLEEERLKSGPIQDWINSEEGRKVFDIMYGISRYQHGISRQLEEALGEDVRGDLPKYRYEIEQFVNAILLGREVDMASLQLELLERFKQRLPITDIHNAAFVIPTNRLLLAHPDTFFFPRGWELNYRIQQLPEFKDESCDYILGLTAQVKSNGWRIFDTTGLNYIRGNSELFANGLLEAGHIPLSRGVYRYELLT